MLARVLGIGVSAPVFERDARNSKKAGTETSVMSLQLQKQLAIFGVLLRTALH